MKKVSLICTFHDERGRANVSELQAILERIRPDVIFLESPPEFHQHQFDIGKPYNLESSAVLRYLETHPVKPVPVDLPTPDESFFRNAEKFFNEVESSSYEYCRLIDQNKERIISEGFAYLNSEPHCKHQADIHKEILKTIERKSSKWMSDVYESWQYAMEVRDVQMLANIESYCRNNEFTRAAFPIGAAHKASIVTKSSKKHPLQTAVILWDYSGNWYE